MAAEICERLASGQSLRQICSTDGMPDRNTVFKWLARDESFVRQYARAREAGVEALAEEIMEIADASGGDLVERDGDKIVDHEAIARSRLRVDTRKWLLSKLAPKKYGDRLTSEHTGPDGGPIEAEVRVKFV